jgi:hypothetical protein
MFASFFQLCLFENTASRSEWQFIAWLPWNCDSTLLDRMLELTMASTRRDKIPAVFVEQSEYL